LKVYLIWLVLIIAWNFGLPDASPSSDVLAAILFSFLTYFLNNNNK